MKKSIYYCIIIILVIITVITIIKPSNKYVSDGFEMLDRSTTGKITNDKKLEQEFVADKNYLKIGIPVANYGQVITKGKLIVKITQESGKNKKFKINLSKLIDNDYYYFNYKMKKGKKYKMVIQVENASFPITIYTTNANISSANLIIDNKSRKDNIALSFMYKRKDYFNIWYLLLVIVLIVFVKKCFERDGS